MKFKLLFLVVFFALICMFPSRVNASEDITSIHVTIPHLSLNENGELVDVRNPVWKRSITGNRDMVLYWYQSHTEPTNNETSYAYGYVVSESQITYIDYTDNSTYTGTQYTINGKTFYVRQVATFWDNTSYGDMYGFLKFENDADNSVQINNLYLTSDEFAYAYANDLLDIVVQIDWNNPVYNESIGYLQNVGLKITGVGGNDFTLTWAVENSEYLSEDYRVQIGYMTNFTKELLGEQKAYTNMDLITWEDELYYSVGRKEFKLKELWNMIPDAISYSHNGYFLLRLVHVDEETGLYETGGWVQVHYILGDGEKDIVVRTPILSSTILEHTGVTITDAYEVEYVEDTNAGGSYYINSANGSVDNISTSIGNATKDWDLSEAANYFYNGITSIVGSLEQFPSLVSKVASFLPNEVMVIMGISIVAIILLRFLGR